MTTFIKLLSLVSRKVTEDKDFYYERYMSIKSMTNSPDIADTWIRGELLSISTAKAIWGEELLCYDRGEKSRLPKTVMRGNVQIGTGDCFCGRQFENNIPAYEYHNAIVANLPDNYEILKYIEPFLGEK